MELHALGLDPKILQRLMGRNYHTAADLITANLLDLVDVTLLSYEEVWEILLERRERVNHLATDLQALDAVLKGGLAYGSVTELCGPPGVGKSQLCMLLCATAMLASHEDSCVMYLDTESKFTGKRLIQIAQSRWPLRFAAPKSIDALTESVLVATPKSSSELLQRLQGLPREIHGRTLRLLIVDSVAALPRIEFTGGQIAERQQLLGQQAAAMKHLAEAYHIPVVVTNQVTAQLQGAARHVFEPAGSGSGQAQAPAELGEESGTVAALGLVWAHAVNARLLLGRNPTTHYIQVAKSPTAPPAAFAFDITSKGPELRLDVEAPPVSGSVIEMLMHTHTNAF